MTTDLTPAPGSGSLPGSGSPVPRPNHHPKCRAAHPRGAGWLLLTAFLAAATVPALYAWACLGQGEVIRSQQEELDGLLEAGAASRREALPIRDTTGRDLARLARTPTGAGFRFTSELVFSPELVELFQTKSRREGEFGQLLKPPTAVTATASRDGIDVGWDSPPDFSALRATLRDHPLLRLGFRVYRWRDGEEPMLLASSDGSETTFRDRDLPLWRVRLSYCVATVLEGTIGDLPTLIESKRSSVITVETLENYTLEVEPAVPQGAGERARLQLSAWIDGEWRRKTVEVAVGERIRAQVERAPQAERANIGRDPAAAPYDLDTGLTLQGLRWIEGKLEGTMRRPEFLPDGRRKLDPTTGLATFRTESITRPTRTLELRCSEPSGAVRTFTSAQTDAPARDRSAQDR